MRQMYRTALQLLTRGLPLTAALAATLYFSSRGIPPELGLWLQDHGLAGVFYATLDSFAYAVVVLILPTVLGAEGRRLRLHRLPGVWVLCAAYHFAAVLLYPIAMLPLLSGFGPILDQILWLLFPACLSAAMVHVAGEESLLQTLHRAFGRQFGKLLGFWLLGPIAVVTILSPVLALARQALDGLAFTPIPQWQLEALQHVPFLIHGTLLSAITLAAAHEHACLINKRSEA